MDSRDHGPRPPSVRYSIVTHCLVLSFQVSGEGYQVAIWKDLKINMYRILQQSNQGGAALFREHLEERLQDSSQGDGRGGAERRLGHSLFSISVLPPKWGLEDG